METQTNIEKVVMRRVRTIRVLRPIISVGTLSALVFVLALWGIGQEVWVARVLTNGPQDTLGHTLYLVYAFEHTKLLVQILTVLTFGSVIYTARELARVIARTMTLASV